MQKSGFFFCLYLYSGKTIAVRHIAVRETGIEGPLKLPVHHSTILLRGLRPHEKAELLNDMDLVTVMCGDGANDCGVSAVLQFILLFIYCSKSLR